MTVQFRERQGCFELPETGWLSHGKPGEAHAFYRLGDASPPLRSLFLKRYHGRRAPAHDLLLPLLPFAPVGNGLPLFLGYGTGRDHAGDAHVYAFQRLSDPLLHEVARRDDIRHDLLFTPAFCRGLLAASIRAFSFLDSRGYYHPDFAMENILACFPRSGATLIDVDSCLPFSVAAGATDCRQTWWTLHTFLKTDDLRLLPPTMILSMAVVLRHALMELALKAGQGGPIANVADIFRAHPAAQRALFDALERGDPRTLSALFGSGRGDGRHGPNLPQEWDSLLSSIRKTKSFSWDAVSRFVDRLFPPLRSKSARFPIDFDSIRGLYARDS